VKFNYNAATAIGFSMTELMVLLSAANVIYAVEILSKAKSIGPHRSTKRSHALPAAFVLDLNQFFKLHLGSAPYTPGNFRHFNTSLSFDGVTQAVGFATLLGYLR
jgi:hypothetical protein